MMKIMIGRNVHPSIRATGKTGTIPPMNASKKRIPLKNLCVKSFACPDVASGKSWR